FPRLPNRLQKSSRRLLRSLAKVAMPLQERALGEMAEWLKAHAWKACVRETVPWVRIPLSPPAGSGPRALFGRCPVVSARDRTEMVAAAPLTLRHWRHR